MRRPVAQSVASQPRRALQRHERASSSSSGRARVGPVDSPPVCPPQPARNGVRTFAVPRGRRGERRDESRRRITEKETNASTIMHRWMSQARANRPGRQARGSDSASLRASSRLSSDARLPREPCRPNRPRRRFDGRSGPRGNRLFAAFSRSRWWAPKLFVSRG